MQELCPAQSCELGAGAFKVPARQFRSLLASMKLRSIDLGIAVREHLGQQEFEGKRKPAAGRARSITRRDDFRFTRAP